MNKLGNRLRELRGKESLRDVAERTGLSHSYISDIEKGYRRGTKAPLKPSPETLKRLAIAYDFSYNELLEIAGYLDKKEHSPSLSDKDERDIQKDLQKMINNIESGNGYSQYDGQSIDDMDQEDKELLIASLENSMRLAKRLAKQKFTPKKYKK